MSNQLRRVIKLAKKTGDRIIVFDNNEPDNSYVVMGLDQYEELLGEVTEVANEPRNKEIKPERPFASLADNKKSELSNSSNIQEKPSSYQQITNNPVLTGEKIADRMNTSDKMWQNEKNFQDTDVKIAENDNKNSGSNDIAIPAAIPEENIYSSGQVLKNRFKSNNWQIPRSIKQAAEEIEQE